MKNYHQKEELLGLFMGVPSVNTEQNAICFGYEVKNKKTMAIQIITCKGHTFAVPW